MPSTTPMRYEILEHTADIGLRGFGSTVGSMMAAMALGVQEIAFDASGIRDLHAYELTASADDLEALLVNWINEVIYWNDAKHVAFARFDIRVENCHLVATGWGEPRNLSHSPRLVVKAATYHLLRVAEEGGGWIGELYLDI